jgi:hypothetical protein
MRKLGLLCCLSAIAASPAFADVVKVEVRDLSNNRLAADVCLYNAQSGNILYATTDATTGRYTFTNLPTGSYAVVASQPGSVGEYDSDVPSHPFGWPLRRITLSPGDPLNGPVCKPKLTITSFVANNKNRYTYSQSVPLKFSTNATFQKAVEYCVAEGSQGVRACRTNNGLWKGLPIASDGSRPAYEENHPMSAYLDVELSLMVRYQDKSQTAAPASTSIHRLGLTEPSIMTGSLKINEDAPATADPHVRVEWAAILFDPSLRVDYCAKQEPPPGQPTARCHSDQFHTISPSGSEGNIATFHVNNFTLTGNPGMKTVAVEMRYTRYPNITAGPARDGIVLSQNIVSEYPCFAESLGGESVVVEDASDNSGPVYVIPGQEAFRFARENGWSFTGSAATQQGSASCLVHEIQPDFGTLPDSGILIWSVASGGAPFIFLPFDQVKAGSCSYHLFGDQTLNPGWTFQGVTVEERYGVDADDNGIIDENEDMSHPLCQSSFAVSSPGGRNMSMDATVHWTDAPTPALFCQRVVTEVRLRGPACADWRDAFTRPPSQ